MTALGIPFAFLSALLFMHLLNLSFNLLTMFGLILVLGMIVDDAIVVSENAYRYMEEGMSPEAAAVRGSEEVAAPVTATILTTAAAFAPLMFINGVMGKFLKFFPMAVLLCLAASLFEALLILPAHLADWVKRLSPDDENKIKAAEECSQKSPPFPLSIICISATAVKKPLVHGEGLPDFWCRVDLGNYYIFFANPKAQNLHLPLQYGQGLQKEAIIRNVVVATPGKTQEVQLKFEPYQSLLLKIDRKGKIEFEDIYFRPEDPDADTSVVSKITKNDINL